MQEERIDILVVDDEETNQIMYSRILGRLPQVDVHVASTGRDAVRKVEAGDFCLVLLDIMMPGMDGFETARTMRESLGERTPPIIFITAYGKDERDKIRGFEEGAADFLFKPYDLNLLEKKVKVFVDMELGKRALEKALEWQKRQSDKISALLEGARDILAYAHFPEAARRIFNRCCRITGATAGYVALLSRDGQENEVLFLEAGGRACSVDPELPMPIRGLRAVAYREKRTVADNDFMHGKWVRFMPKGHVSLDNVMFAPLIIDDCVVGVLGLANKPGGFTTDDEQVAQAFGELAAISLHNARTLDIQQRTTRLMRHGQQIAGLGSFEWDEHEDSLYCSDELAVVLGLDDAWGGDIRTLFLNAHPDDRKAVDTAFQTLIRDGQEVDIEFRIVRGSDVRVVHLQANMDLTRAGQKVVVGACQDVTERREMEQRAVITQKLDALGQLAGGMAHEINTPLQYITNNLGYIASSCTSLHGFIDAWEGLTKKVTQAGIVDEGEQGERISCDELREIQEGVKGAVEDSMAGLKKVSAIIQSLVRFARMVPEGEACCNLNRMVEDTAVLTENHWKGVAEMSLDLASGLPAVVCMPGDISNCLLNLFLNAAQALRAKYGTSNGEGRIAIRTWEENGKVLLTIEDNGVGIPEEYRDKIFEPFFTTKDVGEGTGMGLAVARSSIMAHGGTLDFVSESGKGTVFTLEFPMSEDDSPVRG